MPSLWSGYWNILKLDDTTLHAVKESRDGLWFALKLFVIVGLFVGMGKLVDGAEKFQQPALLGVVYDVADGLETISSMLPLVLAEPLSEITTAVNEFKAGLSQFQPPLGSGVSRFIRLVGAWLSTPFNMMTTWLGFMLIIFLFAKAMHGQGSLNQHVALLTLAVAPQALVLFSYLSMEVGGFNTLGPIGRLLVVLAWIWSLIIVTKALSVAHDFEQSQAVKVLLLFVVGLIVFVLLGTTVGGYVAGSLF